MLNSHGVLRIGILYPILVLSFMGAVSRIAAAPRDVFLSGIGAGIAGSTGYRTVIHLFSVGGEETSLELAFHHADGQPWRVPMSPVWTGNEGDILWNEDRYAVRIPGDSSLELVLNPEGAGSLGWLKVSSEPEVSLRAEMQVARLTVRPGEEFVFEDGLVHVAEIEPVSAGKHFVIPASIYGGRQLSRTAFSVVNVSGGSGEVRLFLRTGPGTSGISKSIDLGPGAMVADFFDRYWDLAFPAMIGFKMRAFIEIESETTIAVSGFSTLQDLPVSGLKPTGRVIPGASRPGALGESLELKVGDLVEFEEAGFTVEFWTVPGDSRCPVDVVCVWEGEAIIDLKIRGLSPNEEILRLTTFGDRSVTNFGGMRFELEEVQPAPVSTQPIRIEDYRIVLKVEAVTPD